jgi:hypothetical protein
MISLTDTATAAALVEAIQFDARLNLSIQDHKSCTVADSTTDHTYRLRFRLKSDREIDASCECALYVSGHVCRHIMFAYPAMHILLRAERRSIAELTKMCGQLLRTSDTSAIEFQAIQRAMQLARVPQSRTSKEHHANTTQT